MKRSIFCTLMGLLTFISVHAQQVTVRGTVISNVDDEPLIGVTVVSADNPNNGTTTDIDGAFQLSVTQGTSIVFSYVGYQSQTLPAQSEMTVYLNSD